MSLKTLAGKHAVATFNPHDQTLEQVKAALTTILGRAGCGGCGRVAILTAEFQGDPPTELNRLGVVSYVEQV